MIDKIDAWEVFWSILVALMSYISIMITFFRKELKEIKKDTQERVLIIMCDKYRKECESDCNQSRQQRDKMIERICSDAECAAEKVKVELSKTAHSHGQFGKAGEVIK